MKKFKLYWVNGETEIIEGKDIIDAFFYKAWYGENVINLDRFEEINN